MYRLTCISPATGRETELPPQLVLALGNFDGVHLAHRALLQATVAWKKREFPAASVGVFCFREPPSAFLQRQPQGQLSTLAEKLSDFADCGIEYVILADFAELRELSPEAFVGEILIDRCRCIAAACGFNHRFGKGGKGTSELLSSMLGGRLLLQEAVCMDGEPISSSRVRSLLAEGETEKAAALLGHPHRLTAPVSHGKALGRSLGAPTANQNFPADAVLPRFGVYVTDCAVRGEHYFGVSNVGVHPTVDDVPVVNCETYLMDFSGDLYGEPLTVSFLHFLRPERRFSSKEELSLQIAEDLAQAADYCKRLQN